MTGKFVLVRHGETEANSAQVLDTRLPGSPLTERGVAQAKSFAAGLTAAPRAVVSSVALRAKQTAGFIADATGVPVVVREGLHEVQLGELEGTVGPAAHRRFMEIYDTWHFGKWDRRIPGGESGKEVLDRFVPVIEELRRRHADFPGDVVVVSHGAAIRLVGAWLTGLPPRFTTNTRLGNSETVELVPRAAGTWTCVRWGRFTPPFDPERLSSVDEPMG